MPAPHPEVGDWYRYTSGELFEVVAIDNDDETIEVQHFDGTIEEMEFEAWESQWAERLFEAAEAPDDWSGSVDMEPEDDDVKDESNPDRQWAGPLEYFERDG